VTEAAFRMARIYEKRGEAKRTEDVSISSEKDGVRRSPPETGQKNKKGTKKDSSS
jgi:hypothetical protein